MVNYKTNDSLPDIQVNFSIEVSQKHSGEKSQDQALTPIGISRVGSVHSHFCHI